MTTPTRTVRVSDENREKIRTGWQQGVTQRDLALQFGVTQSCISKIVSGIPKERSLYVRRCADCGTPVRYKVRCEPCNQKWRIAYNQAYSHRYYLRTKQLDPLLEG